LTAFKHIKQSHYVYVADGTCMSLKAMAATFSFRSRKGQGKF